MASKPKPPNGPSLAEDTLRSVVRATPYDLVVLWTEDGVNEADYDQVHNLAEDIAESTGAVLAVLPRRVVGDVTSYSLLEAFALRDQLEEIAKQLDTVLMAMTDQQSQGDA